MPSLRRAGLSAGAALLFLGSVSCGARSSLVDPPAEKDVPTPAPLADARPVSFVCSRGVRGRPMLVARVDAAIQFAYRDLSSREVFRFSVPSGGYIARADVIARGDRVVAFALVRALNETPGEPSALSPRIEVVVLDVEGGVRGRREVAFGENSAGPSYRLVGNASGLAVLTASERSAQVGLVIDGDRIEPFSLVVEAASDPDVFGRLVARTLEPSSTVDYGFFDTRTRALVPSRFADELRTGFASSSAITMASSLVYFKQGPPRFVVEDAASARELPASAELAAGEYTHASGPSSGGWALFHVLDQGASTRRFIAVHPASGERRTLRLALPPPFTLAGQLGQTPVIDADGEILVGATDGTRDVVLATRDGNQWTARGRPLYAGGFSFPHFFREAGGAIVFRGYGSLPPTLPEGTLASTTLQLVRRGGGEGKALPRQENGGADNPTYADPVLSEDGKCLAYFRNGSLHAVQAETYEVDDLGLVVTKDRAEMAWIPEATLP